MKRLLTSGILFLLFTAGIGIAQQPSMQWRGTLTASCSNATSSCNTTAGSTVENTAGFNNTNDVRDLSGFGLATVTVSGTYAGVTINFEFSDDGGTTWFSEQCTRTDVNIQEPSEALPSNQTRAWDCGLSGPIKFRIRASAYGSGAVNVGVTITISPIEPAPTIAQTNTPGSTDPCQSPSALKQSAAINISSATTTQLVAPVAGKAVFVCGFDLTISQVVTTANTLDFITGTGATCGGSTVTNTGLYGAGGVTAGIPIHVQSSGSGTVFQAASASGVCAVTAIGASGSFQGIITFVQQ